MIIDKILKGEVMVINKDDLINAVIKNKERISYINLDENNDYCGWVDDFNIEMPNGIKMNLILKNQDDIFLLFALASAWSRTGQWENAAYFVTYLKFNNLNTRQYWLDSKNVALEMDKRDISSYEIVKNSIGVRPRRKVSFRSDFYTSLNVLANEWTDIISSLEESNVKNDYMIFVDYISGIHGLGSGDKKMRIKIPLILRELRCQKVFDNIPGGLCCVPDERVISASIELGIKLPTISGIKSLFKASEIIYQNFGNLYDIPLFAYEDVCK